MPKRALTFWTIVLAPACLFAVDGQVLINQATVNAAGGFPYVISQPGSYKLSGNLVVSDPTKDAIVIAHDFVTLDFGGFSIIGTADCSSGSCSGANATHGGVITSNPTSSPAPFFNITIRNGTIQGMGYGIYLWGDSNTVEDMNIRSNTAAGITLLRPDIGGVLQTVKNCNVNLNEEGVDIDGGQVTSNNVSGNRAWGVGIGGGAALVNHNVIFGNHDEGLTAVVFNLAKNNITVSYSNNTFKNNAPDVAPSGLGAVLVNAGQNVCGVSLCP